MTPTDLIDLCALSMYIVSPLIPIKHKGTQTADCAWQL